MSAAFAENVTVALHLDDELRQRALAVAAARGVTFSAFVSEAIVDALAREAKA